MKNSIKILVCNENREERERLMQYLDKSGYSACDEVRDGDTALDYINRGKYDVVITDLWVSGIDGIGIIRQTKALKHSESPAFILTSPINKQSILVEASEAGAKATAFSSCSTCSRRRAQSSFSCSKANATFL